MRLGHHDTHTSRHLDLHALVSPAQVRSSLDAMAAPPGALDRAWLLLRNLPVLRDWRVLSDALFLVISFMFGLAAFVTIVVLGAVGVGTLVAWVGVPILAALFALVIWGAHLERARIRVFLGVHIPSPYRYLPASGKPWKRAWALLRNRQLWRDMVYLLLLLPMGTLGLIIVALPLQFMLAPVLFAVPGGYDTMGWHINGPFEAVMAFLFGVLVLAPAGILVTIAAWAQGRVAQYLLAPSVEEVLSERVEELTESRSAVMRAMHLERRRIERDLHDGAQQRLVSLAMELGLAREKLESDPEAARKLIERSHDDAKLVLAELRDLVRGIHPAVLTDRGLDAAISAVASRSPIPITIDVDLRDRLPEEVEGTAYFVVVEALTNVAKHSKASAARVQIRRDRGWLTIIVADNGRGGADLNGGSGLRGLRDRILALDGTFELASPVGHGTSLTVAIPSG